MFHYVLKKKPRYHFRRLCRTSQGECVLKYSVTAPAGIPAVSNDCHLKMLPCARFSQKGCQGPGLGRAWEFREGCRGWAPGCPLGVDTLRLSSSIRAGPGLSQVGKCTSGLQKGWRASRGGEAWPSVVQCCHRVDTSEHTPPDLAAPGAGGADSGGGGTAGRPLAVTVSLFFPCPPSQLRHPGQTPKRAIVQHTQQVPNCKTGISRVKQHF